MAHKIQHEEIWILLGFDGCFSVDAIGHNGGIILWKAQHLCIMMSYNSNGVMILSVDVKLGRKPSKSPKMHNQEFVFISRGGQPRAIGSDH
ncbi:hypothetical protein LINGRAHAP2_LOCUS5029 [Linum grandiflorum]